MILIDLQKVFDTINDEILQGKLLVSLRRQWHGLNRVYRIEHLKLT